MRYKSPGCDHQPAYYCLLLAARVPTPRPETSSSDSTKQAVKWQSVQCVCVVSCANCIFSLSSCSRSLSHLRCDGLLLVACCDMKHIGPSNINCTQHCSLVGNDLKTHSQIDRHLPWRVHLQFVVSGCLATLVRQQTQCRPPRTWHQLTFYILRCRLPYRLSETTIQLR